MIDLAFGVLIGLALGCYAACALIWAYERVIDDLHRDLTVAGWRPPRA